MDLHEPGARLRGRRAVRAFLDSPDVLLSFQIMILACRTTSLLSSLIAVAAPAIALGGSGGTPINNACDQPLDLFPEVPVAFDTTNATSSGTTGSGVCSATAQRDVFYVLDDPEPGTYVLTTCGTSFPTRVVVYEPESFPQFFGCVADCIASADDPCGAGAELVLEVTSSNETFLIQVGGQGGTDFGTGIVAVNLVGDSCASPVAISGLGAFAYDRDGASASGFDGGGATVCVPAPTNSSWEQEDVFFAWTALSSGGRAFDILGEDNSAILRIYDGSDCSATCLATGVYNFLAGEHNGIELDEVVVGDVLLVQISGWASSNATTLVVTEYQVPLNDTCATPQVVGVGSTAFDNTYATATGFEEGSCGDAWNDLFFHFVVPASGDYVVHTCGSSFETEMAVFAGSDCSAICHENFDTSVDCPEQSSIDLFSVLTGDEFLIMVGGWDDDEFGPGVLHIEAIDLGPPPANNDCSSPTPVFGEGLLAIDNTSATTSGFDGGDPMTCSSPANGPRGVTGQVNRDLFWQFTVPCDGDWLIEDALPFGAEKFSVHAGIGCDATCLATSTSDPIVIAGAQAGDTFLIQWGSFGTSFTYSEVELRLSRVDGPCSSASITVQCEPAAAHFEGGFVDLSSSAFGSGSGSDLHLAATGGPITTPTWGFFLVSADGSGSSTIGNGVLCLGDPGARYNHVVADNGGLPQLNSVGRFDDQGQLENFAGTSSTGYGFDVPLELPFMPLGQTIAPGDRLYFQLWYRDVDIAPGDASNLSNMLEVVFP